MFHSKGWALPLLLGAIIFGGLPNAALALDHDPAIYRLCKREVGFPAESPCGLNPQAEQGMFRLLSREYGLAMAPQILGPAETMGINGFQFDLQFNITSINSAQTYWLLGIEDETPPASLVASRIGVRKGLPASLEVGMHATYLIASELWAMSGMLKWAIHEGVKVFPIDFAVRGTVTEVVGSSDMDISVYGFDAILSKTFGAGGVVAVSPYVAYSPVWIISKSGVVDSTPGFSRYSDQETGNNQPNMMPTAGGEFVFQSENQLANRVSLGTRFILGHFNLAFEGNIAPPSGDGEGLQSYAINLGADF